MTSTQPDDDHADDLEQDDDDSTQAQPAVTTLPVITKTTPLPPRIQ